MGRRGRGRCRAGAAFRGRTRLLAPAERQIPVLNHVLDLPLHRDEEQDEPIHEQDGPEHRDVEELARVKWGGRGHLSAGW